MIKRIICVLFSLGLIIAMCSCGAATMQNAVFYPELVKYKLTRDKVSSEFSFNIEVISSKKNLNLEFVSAEGENTENLRVTFSNDTFDELLKNKIKGKYLLLIGVHCLPISDYTRIDSMTLNVNGKQETLRFETPIENTFYNSDAKEHYLSIKFMPTYIFTQSLVGHNETDYSFETVAESDMVITDARFDDYVDFSDESVSVNQRNIGKLKDVLPLKLSSGDTFKIESKIKLKTGNELYMGNIYTNLIIDYKVSGKKLNELYPMTIAFVGNADNAKTFIEANP